MYITKLEFHIDFTVKQVKKPRRYTVQNHVLNVNNQLSRSVKLLILRRLGNDIKLQDFLKTRQ